MPEFIVKTYAPRGAPGPAARRAGQAALAAIRPADRPITGVRGNSRNYLTRAGHNRRFAR